MLFKSLTYGEFSHFIFERIKEQVTLRTIKYCILMAGFLCVCVPSLYGVENLNVTGKS